MTKEEFAQILGREPSATDQPPGFYRYRIGRKKPWQAVRIMFDGIWWHCLINGQPTEDSGRWRDPEKIHFITWSGPFHSTTEEEYLKLIAAYETAPAGSPLRSPAERIDLRRSKPL